MYSPVRMKRTTNQARKPMISPVIMFVLLLSRLGRRKESPAGGRRRLKKLQSERNGYAQECQ
jgi:hypothetical protein